jgi:hypothetical protein
VSDVASSITAYPARGGGSRAAVVGGPGGGNPKQAHNQGQH